VTMGLTLVVQQGGELPRDRVGVVRELAPGEADDPPAGDDEIPVLGAVVLEGLARPVCGEAVALGDEAVVGPCGIDLAVVTQAIDARSGQVVGVEEGEQAALEDARRDCSAVQMVVMQDAFDGACPSSPRVALEQGIEGDRAREAADLGLVERRLEVLLGHDGREVEQRSRRRRHRDPGLDRDLVVGEQDAMRRHRGPPKPAGSDHLDPRALTHPPQCGGGPERQHRVRARRQDRRHPRRLARPHAVAHGEHAPMEGMQPPRRDPAVDRIRSDPRRDQLRACDQPMLSRGEIGDQRVSGPRGTCAADSAAEFPSVAMPPS